MVWRRHRDGEFRYTARRDASVSAGGDSDGYLYLSSDMPWPRDLDTVIAERRLPDSWLEVSDRTGQDVVRPTARKYLPDPVTVDVTGRETPATGGIEAAFLPGPFRFCLRCGVSYEQVRGRDFAKLATLDQEGRSSATSLISTSIMRSLQAVPPDALDPAARKLLTFVDNRQDASLQAGHFNDFVQVTMLRGALYRAAQDAVSRGEDGLFHEDIATAVTKALALDRGEYALQPGEDPAMRRRTDAALRDVVNLRVYRDLERGWRITMPNLEQAGLLTIGYLGLDGAAGDEALWEQDRARAAQCTAGSPQADLHGAAQRDAPVPRHRRGMLRRRRVRPDQAPQPGVAARRVGGPRLGPAPGRHRGRPARPGRRCPRSGEHVRPRQVRALRQAPHLVPGLRAGDHQRRRPAGHP